MKKNTKIEVCWNDIQSTSEWLTEKIANEFPICKCRSLGYFLYKDKKVLRLSSTIQTGKDTDRDCTIIPVGCITKIHRLK